MDILVTLISFLVAITILVAVHEFGHFWVAKKAGVKVLRFSIGFGKPLFSWRRKNDETEYVVSAIPLGGYVKMLDEREGNVDAAEVNKAFNRKPLASRSAIVFAGPAFNFMFAIFALWMMAMLGVTGVKPVIGEIKEGSPAFSAGLQTGQEIVGVNGEETPIWYVVIQSMLPSLFEGENIVLNVKQQDGQIKDYKLDLTGLDPNEAPENFFNALGFLPWRETVPPVVIEVRPETPAAKAGLKVDDRILGVDGRKIKSSRELIDYVSERPGQLLNFDVERDSVKQQVQITPERIEEEGKVFGRIGIIPDDRGKIPDSMRAEYRYGFFSGLNHAIAETWAKSALTLKVLYKIVVGEVSVRNLSGPINIARYAGQSASAGLPWFLQFLAVVSISLGIINLLPIPVLDGGHLAYYLIEAVKGSPVSEQFEAVAQRLGFAFIILLMSFAIYNDISRIFG